MGVPDPRVCMLLLLQSIEDPADVLLDRVLPSQVNAVNAGCLHEKTTDPIGAWKYNFQPFKEIMTKKPINQPTDRPGHRKVTLPWNSLGVGNMFY